jgi:hypothetical protein
MFCSSTIKPQSRQSARLFLQSSELGLPCRRVCPPLFGYGGRDTLACGREGGGGSQFQRGDRHWGTLGYICPWRIKTQGAYQAGIEMPSTRNRCSIYYDLKRKPEMRQHYTHTKNFDSCTCPPVKHRLGGERGEGDDHRGEKRPKH